MKFNHKELVDISLGEAIIEGRLHHKKISGGYSHSVFKERWFKLRANILFYFNLSETGQIFDKKPVGAYILENVIVQYEMNSEVPFSFSLHFNDDLEKKHLFSGRTQENINKWVDALKQASYEYWRSKLLMLQEQLKMRTGQDPLLMYPRNEGCRHAFETNSQLTCHSYTKLKVQNTFQFYTNVEENVEDNAKLGKFSFSGACNQSGNLENNVNLKQPGSGLAICSGVRGGKAQCSNPAILKMDERVIRKEKERNVNLNSINISPPARPARGSKSKQEVQCANLIDL